MTPRDPTDELWTAADGTGDATGGRISTNFATLGATGHSSWVYADRPSACSERRPPREDEVGRTAPGRDEELEVAIGRVSGEVLSQMQHNLKRTVDWTHGLNSML
jgi:hypothetical protein